MRLFGFPFIFFNFIRTIFLNKAIIWAMVCREIKTRYTGTLAGLLWSVVNPLMMILVYWFVFSVGFKISPPGGHPFILVFLCGLIPWTLFNETLMGSVNIVVINQHLVTKTVFPTEILPLVSLLASLVTHVIMLFILMIVMWSNNVPFSVFNFQFLYYLFALSIFTLGWAWLVAALNVFWRDVGQILGVLLNLWFWVTPIVWLVDMIPEGYRFLLSLNPIMYIVIGYRSAFLYHVPFWDVSQEGLFFWLVSLTFFIFGGLIFRKLKPEFAEVL